MIKNNFQYVFNKIFKIYYTIKEIFQYLVFIKKIPLVFLIFF